MNRKLSVANVSGFNRTEPTNAGALAKTSQAMTDCGAFGLTVVCLAFVLFALAGYGMAELSMLD